MEYNITFLFVSSKRGHNIRGGGETEKKERGCMHLFISTDIHCQKKKKKKEVPDLP